jgi:hypothetical protein
MPGLCVTSAQVLSSTTNLLSLLSSFGGAGWLKGSIPVLCVGWQQVQVRLERWWLG